MCCLEEQGGVLSGRCVQSRDGIQAQQGKIGEVVSSDRLTLQVSMNEP